jgi:hypothetical protein
VVEPSLQLAVAVYVAELKSGIDDGPLMERPVKITPGAGGAGWVSSLLLTPPPPPPPHVRRTIASKAKSNEAGRYVIRDFLISISSNRRNKGNRKSFWEYGRPFVPPNSEGKTVAEGLPFVWRLFELVNAAHYPSGERAINGERPTYGPIFGTSIKLGKGQIGDRFGRACLEPERMEETPSASELRHIVAGKKFAMRDPFQPRGPISREKGPRP